VSRKEIVLLVCRALAAIQFISALLEMSYLPLRFFASYHRAALINATSDSSQNLYLRTYDQIEVLSLFARIAGLLILTVIFWNCGSWIERVFLPKQNA
jgi:hypothetical protein